MKCAVLLSVSVTLAVLSAGSTQAEELRQNLERAQAPEASASVTERGSADELERLAFAYERLSGLYEARSTGGSKQGASFHSVAIHYAQLGRDSRAAARRLRESAPQ